MRILSLPAIFLLLVTASDAASQFKKDVAALRGRGSTFVHDVRTLWENDDPNVPGAHYTRDPPDVGYTVSSLDNLARFQEASLQEYFQLLSRANVGSTRRYTVVLWTGPSGRAKAEEMMVACLDSQDVPTPNTICGVPLTAFGRFMSPNGVYFTDTKIPVLKVTFDELIDGYSGRLDISQQWKNFWMTANCMWLLWNTQVPAQGIDVYASINAYEKDTAGNVSPGAPALVSTAGRHQMVTKAFVIGSFFWDTEMLVLNKRRDIRAVNIHLRTYTSKLKKVTDKDRKTHYLPTPNGWDTPQNLFGSRVPDFPIIFRNSEAAGAERFANFEVNGVTTLHQLIAAYNDWQNSRVLEINLRQSLRDQSRQLQLLVAYSKAVARKKQIVKRGERISSAPGYGDWFDIEQFGAMNEATNDVVVVTAKDLAVLALFILNVCTVTILITKCTKSTKSRGKKVKYEPVSVMSESELVSVQ